MGGVHGLRHSALNYLPNGLASHFGFILTQADDDHVCACLQRVQILPKNATTIF